jgi:UDP-N-acetylmuramate--alanine ligase
MDIYPARELPLPDVDTGMIMRRMQNKAVRLLTRSEILAYLTENKMDVLLTLGAGDIDTLVPEIETVLKTWSTTRI